ncbi:MAG: hypothetical protein LBU56_00840 [Rickettsiales bacterium]|nr:hypothetical protein [Rickettsiales bacterium]
MVLVFGMALVGCGGGSGNGGGSNGSTTGNDNKTGGIFTLTGIPSKYNGFYAFAEIDLIINSDKGYEIIFGGYEPSSDEEIGVRISNGRVEIPMWCDGPGDTYVRYNGSHTADFVEICIFKDNIDFEELAELHYDSSVKFTNGNATLNWSVLTIDYEEL